MNVLIVEDEAPAVAHMSRLIEKLMPRANIVGQLDSVKSVVEWFSGHTAPDVAFLDIQLADGLSFEIFQQMEIKCPIIFTTAYDQYALQAFEVNSIDYLLKPIREQHLQRALDKLNNRGQSLTVDADVLRNLLNTSKAQYKEQFVIKVGDHLRTVPTRDAALFSSEDRATFLYTHDGKRLLLDHTLDSIQELIDPQQFYRISRKHIISMKAIEDIITFSKSRLKIRASGVKSDDLIISRDRVNEFKSWLDR